MIEKWVYEFGSAGSSDLSFSDSADATSSDGPATGFAHGALVSDGLSVADPSSLWSLPYE
jgi:hypothetical protein